MVRCVSQVGVHEFLAGRFARAAVGFDGDKDSAEFVEHGGIVKASVHRRRRKSQDLTAEAEVSESWPQAWKECLASAK